VPKARNILVPLSVWGEGRIAANGKVMHGSAMRSNCLDPRDSGVDEAEDRNSSMRDLVVEFRPIISRDAYCLVREWPGEASPCRMEMYRGGSSYR
jgi:hypothetical protein